MDDIYNDLENYDDVDIVNRLKEENSELKQKLEVCASTMATLQKDYDKLEAEFKRLETSYSSLLQISRAEIRRKTEMITNLNIEKDLLVIKAAQNGPAHKVQQLIRNVREQTDVKRKKKMRNKVGGPKGREELSRRKSSRPPSPATSSTATDNSHKIMGIVRPTDKIKHNKILTQEINQEKQEVFPDHRGDGIRSPVADKRVSALARHQLAKLSSDEEFEDMYSALKPQTREPERSRKRGRDDSQDERMSYNSLNDRPSNYPDPFRDKFNRNRHGRFSDNERNMNRNMPRDRPYNDRNRYMSDSQYQRFSPERLRQGAKEFGDDRFKRRVESPPRERQRLESPPRERQRLESPPRERQRLKSPPRERQRLESPPRERQRYESPPREKPYRIHERRKSFHVRDREHQKADGYDYPETHAVKQSIHGEYHEPQSKRPRIEPQPVRQEERKPCEKQYYKEAKAAMRSVVSCQSPDFSHTEDSSNEPVTAVTEIRTTPASSVKDPRVCSEKYVKHTEGNKEVLQSANANKIHLKPVDKSLWCLEEVHVPKALRSKPVEISEDLVDVTDIDKPLSIRSIESGEVYSDSAMDDISDFQEFNNPSYKNLSNLKDCQKRETKSHKEKSPVDNNVPKDKDSKIDLFKKEKKSTRHKVANSEKAGNCRTNESSTLISKNSSKDDNVTEKISILQRLIESMNEETPEQDNTVKVSNVNEEKDPKRGTDSRILNKAEMAGSKARVESENKNVPELRTSDKLEKPTETKRIAPIKVSDKSDKAKSKSTDKIENENVWKNTGKSKEETERNTDKEQKRHSELKISNKNELTSSKIHKNEHKGVSGLNTKDEPDIETENNVTIYREFEHRVYSTHIVEGDLELSDESNDDNQHQVEKIIEVQKKIPPRKKFRKETSKEKRLDSEDTRKTRSQKDKEKERSQKEKEKNYKLSELFGDSSSLITPEDLNLADRTAHGMPADCCPPVTEEAQDAIVPAESPIKTQTTQVLKTDLKDSLGEPTIAEDINLPKVTKDTKSHTKHKLTSNNTPQETAEKIYGEVKKSEATSAESKSVLEKNIEGKDKLEQMPIKTTTNTTNTNTNEKPKDSLKSNKRPKTKGEKKVSPTELTKETSTITLESDSKKTSAMSDNKENASGNEISEGNISNEMARIFENTQGSSKSTNPELSKINKEELQQSEIAKGPNYHTSAQDIPNLAPVTEEPGLVKMVVISTGTQHLDVNSTPYATPFNALASSTPAKNLSSANISSEMDPKFDQSAHVSVTISKEDSVSQSEPDVPDMRITCYRRRRKVLKR